MELKQEDKLVLALIDEFNGLHKKVEKLGALIKGGKKPEKISEKEWMILHDQYDAMADYRECLMLRIAHHTVPQSEITSDQEAVDLVASNLGVMENAE